MEAFVKYKRNAKFNREFAKILQVMKNNDNAYDMIKSLQSNTVLFNHVSLQSDRIYFIIMRIYFIFTAFYYRR
jgi:hypothetical protein